jgi:hypothetical protein
MHSIHTAIDGNICRLFIMDYWVFNVGWSSINQYLRGDAEPELCAIGF